MAERLKIGDVVKIHTRRYGLPKELGVDKVVEVHDQSRPNMSYVRTKRSADIYLFEHDDFEKIVPPLVCSLDSGEECIYCA